MIISPATRCIRHKINLALKGILSVANGMIIEIANNNRDTIKNICIGFTVNFDKANNTKAAITAGIKELTITGIKLKGFPGGSKTLLFKTPVFFAIR